MDTEDKLRDLLEYETGLKRNDNWQRAIQRIVAIFEDDEQWFKRGKIVLREDATDYIPIELTPKPQQGILTKVNKTPDNVAISDGEVNKIASEEDR